MTSSMDQMTADSMANFIAQQSLLPFLAPGEHLIWSGRPRQGFFLQPQDFFMIPFSLAFAGFAVFWTFGAWKSGAPWFFVLFGVPFIIIGFLMLIGRFFSDSRNRTNTAYGLTDRRVLIVRGGKNQSVLSYDLKKLGNVSFFQNAAGRGSIFFESEIQSSPQAKAALMFNKGNLNLPVFFQIERVKEVYDQIMRAKENSTQ
ncbi:conserved hypothetical protein [Candidatus Zixiibacteriota bacterium]|nr:conserved hypothetical protein [candidate division Zixibacteria bacterium]